jgi:hypothetical protein
MKVVTFCEVDESLFNPEFKVEYFHTTGEASDADIVIIDIDSIFEFEENKSKVTKDKFVSIAIIEDESDYEAFKNFGIHAWIRKADISEVNHIINLVNKRFLS